MLKRSFTPRPFAGTHTCSLGIVRDSHGPGLRPSTSLLLPGRTCPGCRTDIETRTEIARPHLYLLLFISQVLVLCPCKDHSVRDRRLLGQLYVCCNRSLCVDRVSSIPDSVGVSRSSKTGQFPRPLFSKDYLLVLVYIPYTFVCRASPLSVFRR